MGKGQGSEYQLGGVRRQVAARLQTDHGQSPQWPASLDQPRRPTSHAARSIARGLQNWAYRTGESELEPRLAAAPSLARFRPGADHAEEEVHHLADVQRQYCADGQPCKVRRVAVGLDSGL